MTCTSCTPQSSPTTSAPAGSSSVPLTPASSLPGIRFMDEFREHLNLQEPGSLLEMVEEEEDEVVVEAEEEGEEKEGREETKNDMLTM